MKVGPAAPAWLAIVAIVAVVAVGGLAACSSHSPPAQPGVPSPDRPYLLSPLLDYPLAVDPLRSGQLEEAHRALVDLGDEVRARALSDSILALDPGFPPALVLAAQADFVARRFEAVQSRLAPIAQELVDYTAGQLLLARAAELQGEVGKAYRIFRRFAPRSPLASRRSVDLHGAAVAVLRREFEASLERGEIEAAAQDLELLEEWEPEGLVTLESRRELALALGDLQGELEATRELVQRGGASRDLVERVADLELETGDLRAAREHFEDLSFRFPDDAGLAEKLAIASFRWRLRLLPEDVQAIAQGEEVSRAEFAKLIFWLIPAIRYAQTTDARIATDILDHPYRDEIVRVVNLGLMDVDETLRRFAPDHPVLRGEALHTLLRIPSRFEGRVACLEGRTPERSLPMEARCRLALRCGIVKEEAACLPRIPLVGVEAQEWIRHTLELLEGG